MLECAKDLTVVGEMNTVPCPGKGFQTSEIKNKTTPGVKRQESIYDTTKRNYFVIKSNLRRSEDPRNPTELTGGNCFHVEEQQFYFRAIIAYGAS